MMRPTRLPTPELDPDVVPASEHARVSGRVASVNISAGGVPKLPVAESRLERSGLAGDAQRSRRIHGGPMRALCIYSLERIDALRAEGHPVAPGSTGENITLEGIDWTLLHPGSRLALGVTEVEVTAYTVPCGVIRHSFNDRNSRRISQDEHPGWSRVYARVVREGVIRCGDLARVLGSQLLAG